MMADVNTARVRLWGRDIAVIHWDSSRDVGRFEYAEDFASSHNPVEVSPLMMPKKVGVIYEFPNLNRDTYYGLPGMLADCLPDKFGNVLINKWLEGQNRSPSSFSPVEKLCYLGNRGMGALEFEPAIKAGQVGLEDVDLSNLVKLANEVLHAKDKLYTSFNAGEEALQEILRVGVSAGGARAKAIIAWNEKTNEVKSGGGIIPEGFDSWLMKLDGVTENKDKELSDSKGFGRIEYAYYKMAIASGINMSECRLFVENNRAHFMTKRFDRVLGKKVFMQSLCGVNHMDFNRARAYSYEDAFRVMQRLKIRNEGMMELLRRAIFNILTRNQDDHTKNTSFLMTRDGEWSLSPAYDVVYSYNPNGAWTNEHQMTFNGKSDNFNSDDFYSVASKFNICKKAKLTDLLDQIRNSISRWDKFSNEAGVPKSEAKAIKSCFRNIYYSI